MEDTDFQERMRYLTDRGAMTMPQTVRISVPDAGKVLRRGIRYFTGDKAKWLDEYAEIAEWMGGNHGKGLLCVGNCGRGKSLICTRILPVVLNYYHGKIVSVYDAQQMNTDIDTVKQKHILCIDDIGTESMSVRYGERRLAFAELVDEAEKMGKLLLITTNLNLDEMREKYGERTVDRLRAITKAVVFRGASLRV